VEAVQSASRSNQAEKNCHKFATIEDDEQVSKSVSH
jgi:hypothetical protein